MKRGVDWPFVLSIVLIATIISPVIANPVTPSVWKIHFSKDGLPYNEPVNFTINCYGYFNETQIYGVFVTHSPNEKNGTGGPGLVFSRSASCPYYGCPVIVMMSFQDFDSKWCNLEGQTHGKKFFLSNYSIDPLTKPNSCKFVEHTKNSTNIIVPDEVYWRHQCSLNFTIPSHDDMSEKKVDPIYPFTPQSPVASLYCSIVEFLGGRCE